MSESAPGRADSSTDGGDKKPWRDKEGLKELYHGEGKPLSEVASELGCCVATVQYWMEKHDLPTRPKCEAMSKGRPSDAQLEQRYVDEDKSTYDIAEEFGYSARRIATFLEEAGIERSRCADVDEGRVLNLYKSGESYRDVAVGMGTSEGVVRRIIRQSDVEPRDKTVKFELRGEDHPAWRGGTSPGLVYGPGWPAQREKALERDGNKCRACGMDNETHKEEYGSALEVHHVVPFRTFNDKTEANQLMNLVTACKTCHGRFEGVGVFPE